MIEEQFLYVYQSLDFVFLEESSRNCALFNGKLSNESSQYFFRQYVSLKGDGEWQLQKFDWNRKPNSILDTQEFYKQMVNKAAELLYPINMWAGKQSKNGAEIVLNQKIPPKEKMGQVTVSFRSKILSIPEDAWDRIWDKIENRVKYDDHFQVQGFSEQEVLEAIQELRIIFPSSWIKKQFREEAKRSKLNMTMGMEYPPEISSFWFPSYHLSRTAIGAICIDPGWNYLVEMAHSIKRLKSVKGIEKLKNSLTKSSGNQHCLCVADNLHKRGLLEEVEPLIGNGPNRNDLRINHEGQIMEIELKAFTSNSPDKSLLKELQKKIESLPKRFGHPLIFHAILLENGVFDKDREDTFYESIEELTPHLSKNISAVVGGKIFVDSAGGRLKRDCEKVLINENAFYQTSEEVVKVIFKKNFASITYPIYGLGSFFYFGNTKDNSV